MNTKEYRRILRAAADLIESDRDGYMCHAINRVFNKELRNWDQLCDNPAAVPVIARLKRDAGLRPHRGSQWFPSNRELRINLLRAVASGHKGRAQAVSDRINTLPSLCWL